MKTNITLYDCPKITLVRDPEFPDLLEIRLSDSRFMDIIKIWGHDERPVEVTEETLERADVE